MTDIALRGATAADADAIVALFATSRQLLTFLPDLHPTDEDQVYMRDKVMIDHRVTAAERGSRIVGFMAELDGWIEHLHIDTARRSCAPASARP